MALRIDIAFTSPLSDLWSWAADRAADQDQTLAEFVDRLVEVERRKVEGRPRLDPRTRHVGRKGAMLHVKDREYLAGELCVLAGLEVRFVAPLVEAGVLVSARPTGRGKPGAYSEVDVIIAGVAAGLVRHHVDPRVLAITTGGAADTIRAAWPRVRGIVTLANAGHACTCGEAHISARAREMSPAVIVHLETVAAAAAERAHAAA